MKPKWVVLKITGQDGEHRLRIGEKLGIDYSQSFLSNIGQESNMSFRHSQEITVVRFE